MPEFAFPWILLLLVAVPFLLWWWKRTARPAVLFSSAALLSQLPPGRATRARRWSLILRAAMLVLLVIALSGPRWPDPGSRVPTEGIAVALVLDSSRSMDNRDFLWDTEVLTRFEGAKKLFRIFVGGGQGPGGETLAGRKQDLVAVVTFATRPELNCPLTLDHTGLLQIMEQAEPKTLLSEAASNPGDALALALVALNKIPPEHRVKRKVILLLTDGESNVPPPALSPRQAAQLAANLHTPIYAIDTNPEEPAAEDKEADKARANLKELATATGGAYFRAHDAGSMSDVYACIDRLERGKIVSFEYARFHEGFVGFALAALACLVGMVFLDNTRWRTVP